ncbi:MAG: hypothetical protein HC880_22320 [Bacteroidia bacterium]|nr:hypothetical protein [Bacteroidia bacterium]
MIFITAYDQYAVRAFKYSALDYLLKPLDADELIRAVDKALVCQTPNPQQMEVFQLLFDHQPKNIDFSEIIAIDEIFF